MKKLTPIHPGNILLEEFLVPLSINMRQLALAIHVPSGRISQIINGKRDITVNTAYRLGKYFRTGPEFWLNLQQQYNLRINFEDWNQIKSTVPFCDHLAA
ncbi:addiction module antidote protein, HigA family [Candidatus Marinamargulisbacteria bacterium SCGC AAA071-K20]|jgi:antitoxin HigA-1|nr:addiction module antidote protein, HigA family [Candidatus Marinamargulisbacteria bacterium SCGC AAA071-K20]